VAFFKRLDSDGSDVTAIPSVVDVAFSIVGGNRISTGEAVDVVSELCGGQYQSIPFGPILRSLTSG
jgi:hypothetical protein